MAPQAQPHTRARADYSALQQERRQFDQTKYLPDVLKGWPVAKHVANRLTPPPEINGLFPHTAGEDSIKFQGGGDLHKIGDQPLRVGVILSGGQAPGGHNVVAGIFDACRKLHPDSRVFGFLDGPHGIITDDGIFCEITKEVVDGFRNQGGFDMIGSGRHKIESPEQMATSLRIATEMDLNGLVVIGGDDSNTNGALLAEYFRSKDAKTKVVGAPKTIDGDLKVVPEIPVSFGFDTATRTYAEQVGNVAVDAVSSQKYYHFVRLMGRSASNICLEVQLQTRVNLAFMGEEVQAKKESLADLTNQLADMIVARGKKGKNFGVVLIPEGLIEFIPEFGQLISEINDVSADLGEKGEATTEQNVLRAMTNEHNRAVFKYLPAFIRAQLLLDRDPHGNVQVAKIETEKLLAATVRAELDRRAATVRFSPQFHSFGYEGRCGEPSVFDSAYCYSLGATAANLVAVGATGLIASVNNLLRPINEWHCGGVPIPSLCVIEKRKGKLKPVIRKALVELDGPISQPFQAFAKVREELALNEGYRVPGPMQFALKEGEAIELPITLELELGGSGPAYRSPHDPETHEIPFPGTNNRFARYPPRDPKKVKGSKDEAMKRSLAVPACVAGDFELRSGESTLCQDVADADTLNQLFPEVFGAPIIQAVGGDDKNRSRRSSDEVLTIEPLAAAAGAPKPSVIVCFSGRIAPGMHDLLRGVEKVSRENGHRAVGVVGGMVGLEVGQCIELTEQNTAAYANRGGCHLLGRTKDRMDDMEGVAKTIRKQNATSVILVGGATTHNIALQLLRFQKHLNGAAIVTVPCGGSVMGEPFTFSLGYDSNCKANAVLVGNTAVDGASARKYWNFMRVMEGHSLSHLAPTSHVTLEVALQTQVNIALLAEEISAKKQTLKDVVSEVADVVCERAERGKHFGTVVLPDSLLAAFPEFRSLLRELGATEGDDSSVSAVLSAVSPWSRELLKSLPCYAQEQIVKSARSGMDLSKVETDVLLAELVGRELEARKLPVRANSRAESVSLGTRPSVSAAESRVYRGRFAPVCQFLGYQARSSAPSDFDVQLGLTLGTVAGKLGMCRRSGYAATVFGLSREVSDWRAAAVPLTMLARFDAGSESLVRTSDVGDFVNQALPDLGGAKSNPLLGHSTAPLLSEAASSTSAGVHHFARVPACPIDLGSEGYKKWLAIRGNCAVNELYVNPGPIQFSGATASRRPVILPAAGHSYLGQWRTMHQLFECAQARLRPGCDWRDIRVGIQVLRTLEGVLQELAA